MNKKFKMDRVKDRAIKDEYKEMIAQKLENQSSQSRIVTDVKRMPIQQSVPIAAQAALRIAQLKQTNGWFDED
jgi:hypothetical protein